MSIKRKFLILLIVFVFISVETQLLYSDEPALNCALVNPELGTPQAVKLSFRSLFNWLSAKVGRKINVVIIPSVDETVKALQDNNIDFGYTGIVDFFQIQEKFPIQPALTFTRGTQNYYSSCLIVRNEHANLTLKDLKGKRFGFTSFHKQYGGLFPEILLVNNGFDKNIEAFFSSVSSYYSDSLGLSELLKHKIDVCVVTQHSINIIKENSPALVKNITIIDQSKNLMFAPIFYRSDMDIQLRDSLINEFLNFTETSEGQQMLMMFKLDGAKAVTDADYQQDRAIAKRLGYIKP